MARDLLADSPVDLLADMEEPETNHFAINSTRPFELTARHGIEGLAEVADIFTNPIRAGLNLIPGAEFNRSTSELTRGLLDDAGLAKPESSGERIIGAASKAVAGLSPFVKTGSLLTGLNSKTAQGVGGLLKNEAGLQAATAASGATGGQAAKEADLSPPVQFGASLVASLLPSGGKMFARGVASKKSIPDADIEKVIIESGVDLKGIETASVNRLKGKVRDALKKGTVSTAELRRMADFEKVGATPTKASITLDPVDVTQQRNLAKIGAASNDPSLQRLSRVQNENNTRLIQGLNDLGADDGLDLLAGGRSAMGPIEAKRQGLLNTVDDLYNQARNTDGRSIPLNRSDFVNRVDELLVRDNSTAFLPEPIKQQINDIAVGQVKSRGQTFDVPFNVDVMNQLKTQLATAQRSADGNGKHALSLVRQALDETQIQGGASDDAIRAFDLARTKSRELFQFEKSIPAVKAIVDGTDPDRFMEKFIIGKGASVDDVSKLVDDIKANPESFKTVKGQIASWLKDKALNGKADETGILSSTGLNRALKSIGDRKLSLFFSKDEIEQFKAIQRVASFEQFQPVGSAVNNSNTATTGIGGLLNTLTDRSPTLSLAKQAITIPMRARENTIGAHNALNPGLLLKGREKEKGSLLIPLAIGASTP